MKARLRCGDYNEVSKVVFRFEVLYGQALSFLQTEVDKFQAELPEGNDQVYKARAITAVLEDNGHLVTYFKSTASLKT